MSINYTVQLPAGTPLNIENQFGAIKLPDYTGTVSLTSKFGSLTTGNLSKIEKLWVEFGKADIKNITSATSTFKFSTVTLGNLSGNHKMNMEFCGGSRIGLGSDLSSLTLKESYSTVNLKPAGNLSVSYDISTSFGSVNNKSNADIKRTDTPDKYGPDSDKHYEGKSGSGASKVEVKSSFGNIIIGDATQEELESKNKNKNKNKNRNPDNKSPQNAAVQQQQLKEQKPAEANKNNDQNKKNRNNRRFKPNRNNRNDQNKGNENGS